MFSVKQYSLIVASAAMLFSCGKDPNSTGLEYAPAMYHSRAYEPLSQVVDKDNDYYNSNPYNDSYGTDKTYNMNMKQPVKGTLKLKDFTSNYYQKPDADLNIYHLEGDSSGVLQNVLQNPLASSPEVIEEGKVLYSRYCQHCHGESGKGDGLVGQVLKGVPSYSGAVKDRTPGSIFYTITYGRNRMGAHASQVSVEDRWKIVHYVKTLQNQ